jgi:hypothetical protein
MDATETGIIEPVTMSEVLELATWSRPRTDEELENFISSREAAIANK